MVDVISLSKNTQEVTKSLSKYIDSIMKNKMHCKGQYNLIHGDHLKDKQQLIDVLNTPRNKFIMFIYETGSGGTDILPYNPAAVKDLKLMIQKAIDVNYNVDSWEIVKQSTIEAMKMQEKAMSDVNDKKHLQRLRSILTVCN